MNDTKGMAKADDGFELVEETLRAQFGVLLGCSYASLLDEPGGLEFIGAMIRRTR